MVKAQGGLERVGAGGRKTRIADATVRGASRIGEITEVEWTMTRIPDAAEIARGSSKWAAPDLCGIAQIWQLWEQPAESGAFFIVEFNASNVMLGWPRWYLQKLDTDN